jgi:alcohol dehydrogenase (cytochrome c)
MVDASTVTVTMTRGCATACAVVGLLAATPQIQSQTPAASYTAVQAQAGEVTYQDVCSSCHMSDLAGAFEAPPLAGPNFLGMWNGRSARDLFDYITVAMPPAGRKPNDEAITNIVAYILRQNGMDAGDTPLVATVDGAIRAAAGKR